MKIAPKLSVAAMLALLSMPTAALADNVDCSDPAYRSHEQCRADDGDDQRKKPKFQTRFFGE